MLSQQRKKDIKRKLNFIYKSNKSKKNLKIFADEIFKVINRYNKFGKKGKCKHDINEYFEIQSVRFEAYSFQ